MNARATRRVVEAWCALMLGLLCMVAAPDAHAGARDGVIVVASPRATDAAWELARAVYATSLRPSRLTEPTARLLVADPERVRVDSASAVGQLLPLGSTGSDSSRPALEAIAREVGARAALVVVTPPRGGAHARLLVVGEKAWQPVRLEADAKGEWNTATEWLEGWYARTFTARDSARMASGSGRRQARQSSENTDESRSTPFYRSPWFWGAVGAAAVLAGAVILATRDNSDEAIHLDMRVTP